MPEIFDEMRGSGDGIRPVYREIAEWFEQAPRDLIASRRAEAEAFFRRIGITFAVYGDEQGAERIIPFDILPRVITSGEWTSLSKGLEQRVTAINAFIADCYGPREAVKAGIIPEELVLQNPAFRP
ncbi:MAG: circularly permuted type 2 ATP-grasp protein, partial [Methylobacterium sp.]|nr:circularly permuted type 2 ATP-grasp protein [Methylobacterium sp.]